MAPHQTGSLPVVPLGRQGLRVSAQGLGCMGMSWLYKRADEKGNTDTDNIDVIHHALDMGVTFLDTSDVYGPFTNEVLVGKAIQGRRHKYTIATKFGVTFKADGTRYIDTSRKHAREACEASLKRLDIDCIDLYYVHRVSPDTPIEETFEELKALVQEGKVKYLGISEASPDDIRKAHAVHPLSAVQLEWSMWTRDVEEDVIPVCRELGIGIVAYSPLGRGFLTGTITKLEDLDPSDFRRNNHPRFAEEMFKQNMALVDVVKSMAAAKGCTPGQVALAWVHSRGKDVVPIPGTTRIKYLDQNAAAYDVKFSDDELQELEDAMSKIKIAGNRYPDMAFTYHYYKMKDQK